MAGFPRRPRAISEHPSRDRIRSCAEGPQWQGPHGGPRAISAHPSRGSWPHSCVASTTAPGRRTPPCR
eukprot:571100-Pyramimonas_sp.AAC.1